MQTMIDLHEDEFRLLTEMGEQENLSSKELIERVVSEYVERHRTSAFGIWKHRKVDALVYQQSLRDEWPE